MLLLLLLLLLFAATSPVVLLMLPTLTVVVLLLLELPEPHPPLGIRLKSYRCVALELNSVKHKKAILFAASATSSGCSGAVPLPIIGVNGNSVKSVMFNKSPLCPTAPLFELYNNPKLVIDTGNFSNLANE
jgi:hypothetical protein|tara:strand:+ start:558 stop:950 length:393 start_codon:yes stop_codon:yes gene_type:complete